MLEDEAPEKREVELLLVLSPESNEFVLLLLVPIEAPEKRDVVFELLLEFVEETPNKELDVLFVALAPKSEVVVLLVLFSVAFWVFVPNKLIFSFLFNSIFSSFFSIVELLLVLSSKIIVLFTGSLFSKMEFLLVFSSCLIFESEVNKVWLTFSPNCGVVCWSFTIFSSFFPVFFSLFSK